jgi:hypothetical protein
MRLVSRSGLIVTALAVGAITAPSATASSGLSPLAGPLALAQSTAPAPSLSPWAGPLALAHERYGSVTPTPTIVRVTAPGDGFDYGDAAVGAGVVGGIALLTAAGGLTVRRRSQLRHT